MQSQKQGAKMLKLDDIYKIDKFDKLNLSLIEKRKVTDKKGVERDAYINVGYYNNLGSALKGYLNSRINKEIEADVNIDYLIHKITELKLYIVEALTSKEQK